MPRPHGQTALGEREALGPLVEVREGQLQVVIQNCSPETASI